MLAGSPVINRGHHFSGRAAGKIQVMGSKERKIVPGPGDSLRLRKQMLEIHDPIHDPRIRQADVRLVVNRDVRVGLVQMDHYAGVRSPLNHLRDEWTVESAEGGLDDLIVDDVVPEVVEFTA